MINNFELKHSDKRTFTEIDIERLIKCKFSDFKAVSWDMITKSMLLLLMKNDTFSKKLTQLFND